MPAPQIITDLVKRFDNNIDDYKKGNYNETQVRIEFIDPFFKALGWDIHNEEGYSEAYKDVVHEFSLKTKDKAEAPDYLFRIGGTKKFFVEAKKPSINLKDDISPAFQLRRYAWSAKLSLSILTDFEELAVYDCRIKPKKTDKSSTGRINYFTFDEYIERWDEIESIFSKQAILKGSFDRFAESKKGKRGTAEVDDEFLNEIERWREHIARNIALRNEELTNRELNFAVQKTIDRIIFLRICEDRGIEDYGQLMALGNGANVYKRMLQVFTRADEKYNSGLFHFEIEKGRTEPPDTITPGIEIDDKVLKDIINNLYYPDSPYEFAVLPADILGHVYEQFLGKVIRLTKGHRAVVEEKPEVKKAGGVYYTPTYIVDYIVNNTLGTKLNVISEKYKLPTEENNNTPDDLVKNIKKSIKAASEIKILDPACGSGSFLIGAYQYLLDWHLKLYTLTDETADHFYKLKNNPVFQAKNKEFRLTTAEKKRILLNNIYGVDIDSQAVEVTKLSLLLKVLEGETDESINTQLSFYKERALPDLSDNIKCGNSLIGPDFYDQTELMLDDEERFRINVFDWETEFKEIMSNGGFDVVIGNPPYVRQEGLSLYKQYFQAHYNVFSGTSDIYVYFIEKAIGLLKQKGYSSFIVANKWIRSKYGKNLRGYLASWNLQIIIDFADLPVFKNVTTYPAVFSVGKSKPKEALQVCRIQTLKYDSLEKYVKENSFFLDRKYISSNSWMLKPSHEIDLLNKIYSCENTLDEIVGGKIHYGIKTGFDKAFVIEENTKKKLLDTDPKSIELIKPYITGRDVKRYGILQNKKYLLFIPKGLTNTLTQNPNRAWEVFSEEYPAISSYLSSFESVAKKRSDQGDYWWELRACDYYDAFFKNKIIYPNLCSRNIFTYDKETYFANAKCYIIPTTKMYLLGLLNSSLFYFIYENKLPKLRGNYFEPRRDIVKHFPIPSNIELQIQNNIEALVNKMLSLNNNLLITKTPQEKTALQRQIDATDKQIDQLVYKLYNLTEKEIKIVEESVG